MRKPRRAQVRVLRFGSCTKRSAWPQSDRPAWPQYHRPARGSSHPGVGVADSGTVWPFFRALPHGDLCPARPCGSRKFAATLVRPERQAEAKLPRNLQVEVESARGRGARPVGCAAGSGFRPSTGLQSGDGGSARTLVASALGRLHECGVHRGANQASVRGSPAAARPCRSSRRWTEGLACPRDHPSE